MKNATANTPLLSLATQKSDINLSIGVREGILLGGRKKFALKITICPENNFFSLIRMGPKTSCKSVLHC